MKGKGSVQDRKAQVRTVYGLLLCVGELFASSAACLVGMTKLTGGVRLVDSCFFFFFIILRRMEKNKALAHHASTYFHTRRVSI